MTDNVFLDKKKKPDNILIKQALGEAYPVWDYFLTQLNNDYKFLHEEWKFYGSKYGWGMKMLMKKRNLFFFSVCNNFFIITFVFGDRGVMAVEKSDLPSFLINELVNAAKYAEGRGLKILVRNKDDIHNIIKLVKIKVEN
jgi:hypothetical protein